MTSAKPFTQQKCTWIMKVLYGHSFWQRGISISLTHFFTSKIFYISSVSKRQVVLYYHKHKEERISKTHFLEKAKLPKSYVKFSWRILNFSTSALVFFLLSAVFANKERWETFCCCLHLFLKMVSYCHFEKKIRLYIYIENHIFCIFLCATPTMYYMTYKYIVSSTIQHACLLC